MHTQQNWLALALTEGMDATGFLRLIQTFGSADLAHEASLSDLAQVVDITVARRIRQRQAASLVEATLHWSEGSGCSLMTLLDEDYPLALAQGFCLPPLLYLRGNRQLMGAPMLAIVGSQRSTLFAQRKAAIFAQAIASRHYATLAGFGSAIAAAVHESALDQPGSSIAVISTGIDLVYPARAKTLAERLIDKAS